MSTPVCTVCIANFNGEALLPDCIDSVLQQDCDFDIEIIVHDDASTDASVDILKSRYPGVKIIESEDNVGFCISNNRMAAQANGDYLLLLNNDAALYSDALQTLFDHAQSIPEPSILSLPQYDWTTGKLVDRGCLLDPFYNPVPNTDPQRREVAYVIGACLWIPRKLWLALGGFPEWMESIAEDMYLGCRARLSGCNVLVTTESGYRHRQGVSFGGNRAGRKGLSTTYRRRYLSERNKTAVLITCTPSPFGWLLLLLHSSLLLLEGVCMTVIRRDARILGDVYYSTLKDTARHIPRLFNLRKDIQKGRKISFAVFFSAFSPRLRKMELLFRHGVPRLD